MVTDYLSEVYVSMSRNRLRIALTGFSIAWGIFMLIVLLGAGNGLLHGIMKSFGSQATNKVSIYSGWTSISYEGLPQYREISLLPEDVEFLSQYFSDKVSDNLPCIETSTRMSYGQEYVNNSVLGVTTGFIRTIGYKILAGRDINEIDQRERRKVLLITDKTSELLFGDTLRHLGVRVNLNGLSFQVVGYYKSDRSDSSDDVFAPLSTIGTVFKPDGHYSQVKLIVRNLETKEANEKFNEDLQLAMARHRRFDPKDKQALWIWNSYEDYLQTQTIFSGLRMFIWIIGLATLIAGVTGISNIMLITVRERTHEFGIRKALGARPRQIVSLVIIESIAITLLFGYVGMFCGIGLTQLVDYILTMQGDMSATNGNRDMSVFVNPTVDMGIVMAATVVMVVAGVIAGYVPAKRAVSIKPVEALAAQ
ncbi:MAG: ABC transporter permease [Bacteroidales bacterium]|nr:ABC transporter permease [Bacteroidales bacterium]